MHPCLKEYIPEFVCVRNPSGPAAGGKVPAGGAGFCNHFKVVGGGSGTAAKPREFFCSRVRKTGACAPVPRTLTAPRIIPGLWVRRGCRSRSWCGRDSSGAGRHAAQRARAGERTGQGQADCGPPMPLTVPAIPRPARSPCASGSSGRRPAGPCAGAACRSARPSPIRAAPRAGRRAGQDRRPGSACGVGA